MFSGLGYVSGYLVKDRLYTLKYNRSIGIFYYPEFEAYLKWYIQNSAVLISILKQGAFPEEVYITINPIVSNLTADYIVSTINKGIEQFRAQYAPTIAMSTLSFVDIKEGSGTVIIQQEKAESTLPGWAKDLIIVAGVVLIGAVAVNALLKKN